MADLVTEDGGGEDGLFADTVREGVGGVRGGGWGWGEACESSDAKTGRCDEKKGTCQDVLRTFSRKKARKKRNLPGRSQNLLLEVERSLVEAVRAVRVPCGDRLGHEALVAHGLPRTAPRVSREWRVAVRFEVDQVDVRAALPADRHHCHHPHEESEEDGHGEHALLEAGRVGGV